MGLNAMQILLDCEEQFGIEMPEEATEFPTIGEFSDYIARRLPRTRPDAVWERVRKIASEALITPIDAIRRDSLWADLE